MSALITQALMALSREPRDAGLGARRRDRAKRAAMNAPVSGIQRRRRASPTAWRCAAPSVLKALSFALVGVVNTAVDASVFFLLLAYVTSSLIAANVAAWFVAVTGSYVMNSFTTFAAESGREAAAEGLCWLRRLRHRGVIANTTTVVLRRNSCRCGLPR